MTLVQSIVDYWRMRLEALDKKLSGPTSHDSFKLDVERRILKFVLWRYVDAPHSTPPREAQALDAEAHKRSETLFLSSNIPEQPLDAVAPHSENFDFDSLANAANILSDEEWFVATMNSGIRHELADDFVKIPAQSTLNYWEWCAVLALAGFTAVGLLRLVLIIVGI